MQTRNSNLLILFLLLAGTVPAARAQQQAQDQSAAPIPAYHSPFASAVDNGNDQDTGPQTLSPDTRSLIGVQTFSLGTLTTHSYWKPSFNFSSTGDSNPLTGTGNNSWTTWTSISAAVDVHRASNRSDMDLTYTGGGMFSDGGGASNGIVQELNASDRISLRRWSLSFTEQLNYLPEAAFGFNGLGGATSGGSASTLSSGFSPDQSILTERGQNLGNSSNAEADIPLTGRTSLTFVGGYSLLRYFGSNMLNSGDMTFRGGYNYQLTRRDTIAVSYTFSGYSYSDTSQKIDSHTVQASYGRRVTGRLAFQISGGPTLGGFVAPISGGSGGGGTGGGTTQTEYSYRLYASLNAAAQYQLGRMLTSFTYYHGLSAGSGVYAGSINDLLSASLSRQISRTLSGGLSGGYSRNKTLPTVPTGSPSVPYDYWFVSTNLSHPIGRSLAATLSYQLQHQNSNGSSCEASSCQPITRNLISFTFGWHERPLLF